MYHLDFYTACCFWYNTHPMENSCSTEPTGLPFLIDRNVKTRLPEQVADGFRQAIKAGCYAPGDTLPSRHEIAEALGVSVRVSREAMAMLAAESVVRPRRGVGCVVLRKNETLWKGRVVFVQRMECEGAYNTTVMLGEARRRLTAASYQCSFVTLDRPARRRHHDMTPLVDALRQHADFVFAAYPTERTLRFLESSSTPFAIRSASLKSDHALRPARNAAYAEFVAHCRAAGVRRILFSGYAACSWEAKIFRDAGFDVEDMSLPPNDDAGFLEAIERRSMDIFLDRFSPGSQMPDLLYLADDYVARGALTALLARGVRVPEDLRVVAFANKGFSPVFPTALTRIENDPFAFGRFVADWIASRIEGKEPPDPVLITRYITADSFPAPLSSRLKATH